MTCAQKKKVCKEILKKGCSEQQQLAELKMRKKDKNRKDRIERIEIERKKTSCSLFVIFNGCIL